MYKWNSKWKFTKSIIDTPSQVITQALLDLNNIELKVITRLISGHCLLNQYKNEILHIHGNGDCLFCNEKETVEHYLIHCNKYKNERIILLNNIRKINSYNTFCVFLLFHCVFKIMLILYNFVFFIKTNVLNC